MKSFKKICIIRDDRLGDAILTLPIINKLKKTYKNSKITLVISPISAELVKKFDFFDNLIVSKNNLETLKEINQNNFDLIINFAPLKNKFYKLFLKSKNKIHLSFQSRYKKKKNRRIQNIFLKIFFHKIYFYERNNLNELRHQTEFMDSMLISEELYDSEKPKRVKLKLKNLSRFDYLIHLSDRWFKSEYENKNFTDLIGILLKNNSKISITTDLYISNNLRVLIDEIIKNFKLQCFIMPSFDEWINLINQSNVIITAESGCSHICGLLNKKTIIIYDSQNKPEFIMKEFKPYENKNSIQIKSTSGKKLNSEIISCLNQF
jgi:ADP-heptose:LPS heptosyltransferase